MPTQATYIEVSDTLRKLFATKRVDFQAELGSRGVYTDFRGLSLMGRPKSRDPFLIILGSAVAVSLVGSAISQIVASLSDHKRAQMTERNLQVALDRSGHAIIDADGNPVYNLAERPGAVSPRESTTKLIVGKLLSFDISSVNAEQKTKTRKAEQKSRKVTNASNGKR